MNKSTTQRAVRQWRQFLLIPDGIAAVTLLVLTGIFLVGVFLRYVLHAPSAALNDWALLAMVPACTFALASADRRGGHIAVDLVVRRLPQTVQRWIDRAVALVGACVCFLLAYAMMVEGIELRQDGIYTIMARIGAWYQHWLLSVAYVLFGVQLLFRTGGHGDDISLDHFSAHHQN